MRNDRDRDSTQTTRSTGTVRRLREHPRRLRHYAPLLVFAVIGLLVARQEIPAVDSWISRLLDADAWNATEACRKAALAAVNRAEYARLERAGKATRTEGGYFVEGVEYASLTDDGKDRRYRFSCNVSHAGEVEAISSTLEK